MKKGPQLKIWRRYSNVKHNRDNRQIVEKREREREHLLLSFSLSNEGRENAPCSPFPSFPFPLSSPLIIPHICPSFSLSIRLFSTQCSLRPLSIFHSRYTLHPYSYSQINMNIVYTSKDQSQSHLSSLHLEKPRWCHKVEIVRIAYTIRAMMNIKTIDDSTNLIEHLWLQVENEMNWRHCGSLTTFPITTSLIGWTIPW